MVKTEAKKSYISLEPIGPLLIISPWNFPIWLPMKSCISQLCLGNTILFKPAPNVSLCADALQESMAWAGLEKEFQLLHLDPEDTEKVISHDKIRGVGFTGSTNAGRHIGEIAARHLKKF